MSRPGDAESIKAYVAYARKCAAEARPTTTIYNRRETLRHVRNVSDDGACEVLCGKVWRPAYVEPFGLGKIFVGHGSRRGV